MCLYPTEKQENEFKAKVVKGLKWIDGYKCRALAKDVFGLDVDDIVATKIWIPKAELDRVKRRKVKVQQW